MENPKKVEIAGDVRQSGEYGEYMESIGWKVFETKATSGVDKLQLFVRKIGPVGIAKLQRTKSELPMAEVEKILKENKVMMCKIEPLEGVKPHNYRLSNWPLLGTRTLRVDLRFTESEIFDTFKKDCRYVLRKVASQKSKVKINEFDSFYGIWKQSAKRKSLWIPKEKEYKSLIQAFGDKCFCVTIGDLAGALVLTHKQTAFYYYAGSTAEGTKLNLPYMVVWEAMREAKKRGSKVWDFEGIYDPRWPNKGWQGFTHFKKSFGGEEIEFPGSFEKWRWPF